MLPLSLHKCITPFSKHAFVMQGSFPGAYGVSRRVQITETTKVVLCSLLRCSNYWPVTKGTSGLSKRPSVRLDVQSVWWTNIVQVENKTFLFVPSNGGLTHLATRYISELDTKPTRTVYPCLLVVAEDVGGNARYLRLGCGRAGSARGRALY